MSSTTPLQIISGIAEVLENNSQSKCPKTQKYAQKIRKLVKRMSGITRHLLKLSRKETDSDEVIDLRDPILETLDLMKMQLQYDHIEVNIELPKDELLVRGNLSRICGIFQNLLANSRDAFLTNCNESHFHKIDIDVELDWDSKSTIVVYRDNAGGISKDIVHQVFDPFFTTKDVNSGTGLGLSLTRQTVEEMGGSIDIDSENGETEFKMVFPLCEVSLLEVNSIAKTDLTQNRLIDNQPKTRVLIVDDEEDICELMGDTLEVSMDVTTTSSPEEAMSLIDQQGL